MIRDYKGLEMKQDILRSKRSDTKWPKYQILYCFVW